jgi:hypothetical protein
MPIARWKLRSGLARLKPAHGAPDIVNQVMGPVTATSAVAMGSGRAQLPLGLSKGGRGLVCSSAAALAA